MEDRKEANSPQLVTPTDHVLKVPPGSDIEHLLDCPSWVFHTCYQEDRALEKSDAEDGLKSPQKR